MTPVSPIDLPAHWAFVEAGLNAIIRLTGEEWTPTHVKCAIHHGAAFLHVCEDGFAVLEPSRELWTGRPYMNVWALWFKPGRAKARRAELFAWLDEKAKAAGLFPWKFGSPRMGWGALEDNEMEIERVIWRRKT